MGQFGVRFVQVCFCLVFAAPGFALGADSGADIGYFQTDLRYEYRIKLLELALEKTRDGYGDFHLVPVSDEMSQGRGLEFLRKGENVRVAFLPTTSEREKDFLAIRIPILRGILGYRVFLIHQDARDAFAEVASLEELKARFTAGFGTHWADKAILVSNGIAVVDTPSYDNLFGMLNARRFDYFPRGINEAWHEVEKRGADFPKLMVEPELALYYPYAVYFFVNRKDDLLAQRIDTGLRLALSDGSFEALFREYHEEDIRRAGLDKRRLFILENPTLPETTDVIDTRWWLPQVPGASD